MRRRALRRRWLGGAALLTGLAGGIGGSGFACGGGSGNGVLPTGEGGANGTTLDGFGEPCSSDKHCREYQLLCGDTGCVECLEALDCPEPSSGEAVCNAGRCENITPCVNSLDCPSDQVCDRDAGHCVECLGDDDCDDELVCLQRRCAAVQSCRNSLACAETQVCDRTAELCVDCVGDNDCEDGEQCLMRTCVPETTCTGPEDCSDDLVCDTASDRCVECLTREDCNPGERCQGQACVPDDSTCERPRVALLIQRSGAMFEQPGLEDTWWDGIRAALIGTEGLVAQFQDSLDLSVSAYYRETSQAGSECPLTHDTPGLATAANVEALLDEAEATHAAAIADLRTIDAPVAEAVQASAAALAEGSGGPPVIVLVTTSIPDTCTETNHYCGVVPIISEVQEAWDDGITTYVLGLQDSFMYQTYLLESVANAGVGEPVAEPPDAEAAFSVCPEATYSDSSGEAPYFLAEAPGDIAEHLATIFTELAADCEP